MKPSPSRYKTLTNVAHELKINSSRLKTLCVDWHIEMIYDYDCNRYYISIPDIEKIRDIKTNYLSFNAISKIYDISNYKLRRICNKLHIEPIRKRRYYYIDKTQLLKLQNYFLENDHAQQREDGTDREVRN